MNFIEDLIYLINEKKSVVCMGLDPRMDKKGEIPQYLIEELQNPNNIIKEFNKILIENTYDLIPVIKPQIAFYEKYDAIEALKETIKFAHKKDLLVILDAKRNDIGSTSEAYAYSIFNNLKADACTINAYLGFDGVKPFLNYKDRGVFILTKTSNPSSVEFQDLFSIKLDKVPNEISKYEVKKKILKRNYLQMAELINDWSKNLPKFSDFTNIGAVVGATFPQELKKIRDIIKNSFILIPGYGAQGALAKDIKHGFYENSLGSIVNSSRNIIYAYNKTKKYNPEDFGKAARNEIINMSNNINKVIGL
ncbi:MAG: orotidine-5'-phosphate decarboxylase [Promethearchaeota archaeon]|nr:MAG: orotidine-5'-phosphate decarboxylase [Candidatus Lokiarchaeota archaeon]